MVRQKQGNMSSQESVKGKLDQFIVAVYLFNIVLSLDVHNRTINLS